MRRRHIDVTALTRAPAGTVYDLLVDGATWPDWSPIESFELERPGDPAPEGVGAIRRFRLGRTTGRDEILERVPHERFAYSSLSGVPVRDYVGAVDLTETAGGGTSIYWHVSFFPAVRGTGWIVERSLRGFLQKCANGLAAYAGAASTSTETETDSGTRPEREHEMSAVEAISTVGAGDFAARSTLLEAFRRREPNAVRTMYRDYGRLVYVVAHRVLRRDDLAQDAVQQTFVQAWRAADRIDVDRDPTHWLMTIAKHAAIDLLRYEARRSARSLTDTLTNDPALAATSIPDLETLDTAWRVRRAIDELPPDEAMVVRLQYLDGLTQVEVAKKLGVALGTVKSRSHRAHRHLAARLRHLRGA